MRRAEEGEETGGREGKSREDRPPATAMVFKQTHCDVAKKAEVGGRGGTL